MISSGGSYGANTGSVTRTVPDLTVPGCVGAYPLTFSRSFTSRYMPGETDGSHAFGKPGSWRHSYNWGCYLDTPASGSTPAIWRVHYPDGSVVRFTFPVTPPATNADPYMRSVVAGLGERLEAVSGTSDLSLHRSDGGTVYFHNIGSNTFQAVRIYDPFNQRTDLAYNTSGTGTGKVSSITDSSGRYLQLTYAVFSATNETVVASVTASNSQSVNYNYTVYSIAGQPDQASLTSVTYTSDLDQNQNPYVATYKYQADNTGAGLRPLLASCDDPHFPGPMPRIRYTFVQSSSAVYGQIKVEVDDASGTAVSTYDQSSYTETRGDGPTSTYTYPANGYLLTSQTDYETGSAQGTTSYNYDSNAYVNKITNRNAHVKTIVREPFVGKRMSVTVTDPATGNPLTTSYNYGTAPNSNYTYPTAPYWLLQVTDPRGNQVKYARDASHQVTRTDYPDGTYETFAYNSVGQVTSHRKPNGSTYTFTYDSNRNLTQSTDSFNSPNSTYTKYSYDSVGRLQTVTDFKGHQTTYSYNGRHQITQIKHDDNSHLDYGYDKYGNRTSVSDEHQKVTTSSYDNHRRPTTVTVPVNAYAITTSATTYSYERGNDATGNATTSRTVGTVTLPSGKKIKNIYTNNGFLKSVTKGSGNSDATQDVYTYDKIGHLLTAKDANGITQQTYVYDALERKSTFTDANGHVTTWTYYPASNSAYAGWLQSVSKPGSSVGTLATTQYLSYDAVGRVLSQQDPSSNATGYAFDSYGRLWTITDANGGTYTYGYDVMGRINSLKFPDTTTETWAYDAAGNSITFNNRAGNRRTTQYDDRDRARVVTWDDSLTASRTITVDLVNHLTEISTPTTDVKYAYDDAGGMTSESDTIHGYTETTGYTRDVDGNVTQFAYPNGDQANYYYDDQNRCVTLGAGSTPWSKLIYDGEWVVAQVLGNLLMTQYEHDPNGRIWMVWDHSGQYDDDESSFPAGNISYRHYGYEPNNQVAWCGRRGDSGTSGSALENNTGESYQYQRDGSLSAFSTLYGNVTSTGNAQSDSNANPANLNGAPGTGGPGSYCDSFHYDGAGNRTSAVQMGSSISYSQSSQNQDQYSTWSYVDSNGKNNGNVTNMGDGWTYSYDAEGKMLSAIRSVDNSTMQFDYDGTGRLVYQNAGTATIFCYAGAQRIEERAYTGNGSIYRYFYAAPGSDQIVYRQQATNQQGVGKVFYQYDAMGNTTHISDQSGNILENYLYDGYGTPYVYDNTGTYTGPASQNDNRYLFHAASAYEYLPDAGVYYCRARVYTPVHGRFLQPDPSGFAGGDVNLYRYCGNDPVNGSDPSGMFLLTLDVGVQGSIGTAGAVSKGWAIAGSLTTNPADWMITTTQTNAVGFQAVPSVGGGVTVGWAWTSDITLLVGTSSQYSGALGLNGLVNGGLGLGNVSPPSSYDGFLSLMNGTLTKAVIEGTLDFSVNPFPEPIYGNGGAMVTKTTEAEPVSFSQLFSYPPTWDQIQSTIANGLMSNMPANRQMFYSTVSAGLSPNWSAPNSPLFTDPSSPYYGQPEWDIMGGGLNGPGQVGDFDLGGGGGGVAGRPGGLGASRAC